MNKNMKIMIIIILQYKKNLQRKKNYNLKSKFKRNLKIGFQKKALIKKQYQLNSNKIANLLN